MELIDKLKIFIDKYKYQKDFIDRLKNEKLYDFLINSTSFLDNEYKMLSIKQRIYHIKNNTGLLHCRCGKVKEFKGSNYIKTCGNKECTSILLKEFNDINKDSIKIKRNKTIKERYGDEQYFKTDLFKEKAKTTIKEKYGVDHYLQSKDYKEKSIITNREKYGVDVASKSPLVSNKMKSTIREKYGVDHYFQTDEFKEKTQSTIKEKYGVDHYFQTDEYKSLLLENNKNRFAKLMNDENYELIEYNNVIKLKCNDCSLIFETDRDNAIKRKFRGIKICTNICDNHKNTSNGQESLLDYIKSIYDGTIIINDRKILDGIEIDIYLPDLNIGFEYNGVYWHSHNKKSSRFHQIKKLTALDKNVKLYFIWEDLWMNEKEKIKNIISNKIGLSEKVYARKCTIKNINTIDERRFLNDYHIQGYSNSTNCIGLYYNDELISLMSFIHRKNEIEIERICTKFGINIIGGTQKLFKSYIKNIDKPLISYCSMDLFDGDVYSKLGMKFDKITEPSYFYIKNLIRLNRQKFQKHKLIKIYPELSHLSEKEIMIKNKFMIIYNSGNMKFKL